MDKSKMIYFCKNPKNYVAFLLFFFLWFLILGFSGTITSGFHFTDDHEIIRMNNDLKTESFLNVSKKWMVNDLKINRFRPLYYFHRVFETKIFGTNMILWSIYNAILAFLTSLFLFYFLKLLKYSFWESLFFSLISLIGSQFQIWWRLGPNETLGIFLLSVAFLFLGLYIAKEENVKKYKTLFVVFVILATLSKESFLLFVPAMIFLLVYFSYKKDKASLRSVLRKNWIAIAILSIVTIAFLFYIKFFLGTGGVGYAGIDGVNFKSYCLTFFSLVNNWLGWLIGLVFLVNLVEVFLGNKNKEDKIKSLKELFLMVCLFFIAVLPQVVLYAKSGFAARYLLPVLIGFSLVFVMLLARMSGKLIILKICLLFVVAYFLQGEFRNSMKDAQDFAKDGKSIGNLFHEIELKTVKNDAILIVGDPVGNYEWAESIGYYLNYELGRKNLFVYSLVRKEKVSPSEFEKNLALGFGGFYGTNRYENIQDKGIIDAVILFPGMDKVFSRNQAGIDFQENKDIKKSNFGGYIIYYKIK